MTDHSSIKYISTLLGNPGAIATGDQESIVSLRKAYPYLVPVRYLSAVEANKQAPFSDAMLSEMQPYLGNWILFCDFLEQSKEEWQEQDVVADIVVAVIEDLPEEQEQPIVADVVVLPVEEIIEVIEIEIEAEPSAAEEQEPLIAPLFTQDYFLQQGEKISDELPGEIDKLAGKVEEEEDKSLMVMMSFSEWLLHFKNTSEQQEEEKKDQKALRTMWQKEKLAAAMEEENEEIPEGVFEMAVNSITKEEDLASEPLAKIYIKQGKYDQAIEMYRKLSLRNPQKSAYFARKIEEILKEKS